MKTLLISFVLVVNLCLTNGASANAPPTEITDTFFRGRANAVCWRVRTSPPFQFASQFFPNRLCLFNHSRTIEQLRSRAQYFAFQEFLGDNGKVA